MMRTNFRSQKRTHRVAVLAVASLLSGVVALVTPALPASASATHAGDKYVALGSSFASGPIIPEPADAACLRSTNNYAHLVATKLKLALTDVTCSGAATANVVSTPQGSHPVQISAVTPDTKLVTITIGGNDVDYSLSTLACADAGTKGEPCLDARVNTSEVEAKLAALQDKVVEMLDAIKTAAPDATIYLVAYLRVLPASGEPCPPSVPLDGDALDFIAGVGRQLQSTFKRSARAAGVGFIDAYSPKGHDACAEPDQRWVEGQVQDSPAFPFHPNAAGMTAVSKLIVKRLKAS